MHRLDELSSSAERAIFVLQRRRAQLPFFERGEIDDIINTIRTMRLTIADMAGDVEAFSRVAAFMARHGGSTGMGPPRGEAPGATAAVALPRDFAPGEHVPPPVDAAEWQHFEAARMAAPSDVNTPLDRRGFAPDGVSYPDEATGTARGDMPVLGVFTPPMSHGPMAVRGVLVVEIKAFEFLRDLYERGESPFLCEDEKAEAILAVHLQSLGISAPLEGDWRCPTSNYIVRAGMACGHAAETGETILGWLFAQWQDASRVADERRYEEAREVGTAPEAARPSTDPVAE